MIRGVIAGARSLCARRTPGGSVVIQSNQGSGFENRESRMAMTRERQSMRRGITQPRVWAPEHGMWILKR